MANQRSETFTRRRAYSKARRKLEQSKKKKGQKGNSGSMKKKKKKKRKRRDKKESRQETIERGYICTVSRHGSCVSCRI